MHTAAAFLVPPTWSVGNQTMSKSLHDFLLTDYDPALIPLCAPGDQVTLNIDIALRQIMDLVGCV